MWTLSRLREKLAEHGIRPSRGMGQNFLVDGNFVLYLIREAKLKPGDAVLEIGPGPGVLTPLLAAAVGWVLAVELDPRLAEILRGELGSAANVELIVADVLAGKNRLNPAVFERLTPRAPIRVIANLPYAVATPAMLNLLESGLPMGESLVTVQKEIAERWAARPRTKSYGAVSVRMQILARVEIVRTVPPAVFWPAPHVQSAVVRLHPQEGVAQSEAYREACLWIDAAFAHRRKALARNITASGEIGLTEAEVLGRLAAIGRDRDTRAEELSPEEFVVLARDGGG